MDKIANTESSTWPRGTSVPGLVSVIIPTYNRATLLPLTLDSVWQQTYRPIEVMIIDDGSTDGTPAAAEHWATEHADDSGFTMRVLRRENRGAPIARNEGAELSLGEYIQFFDSDDLMRPEKLARSIAVLRAEPELDFVTCDFLRFQEKNGTRLTNMDQWVFSQRKNTIVSYVNQPCLSTHSPVFRRSSLSKVGPWAEDLPVWQDFEYGFRIFALLKGKWLPEVLYDIRITPNAISDTKARKDDPTLGEAYVRACAHIEKNARALNIFPEIIRKELGVKLAKHAHSLAGKKSWTAYEVVSQAAICRLGFIQRSALVWHRLRLKLRRKY